MDRAAHNFDLWIIDIARNLRTRFTSDQATEAGARWSSDGKTVAYYVDGKGIFLKPSGGSGAERQLLAQTHEEYPDSMSPDDRSLLYEMNDPNTSWDLWILSVGGDAKPRPFLQAPLRQEFGRFSPDGRWVAYRSTESGRSEIYVVPFPGSGDKVQVSTSGGIMPRWRRDGKEIFYLGLDNRLMAAAVDGRTSIFQVGSDQALFAVRPQSGPWPYDVSADGQRFLVNSLVEQVSTNPLTVVVNWQDALKK